MGNTYYGPTRMKKSSAGNGPKGRGRGPAGAEQAGKTLQDDPISWPGLPGQVGPERNTVKWPTVKTRVVKKGGHF